LWVIYNINDEQLNKHGLCIENVALLIEI
jgi:hypothetical protein